RIQREVCRETELHPLVRWQFRGLPESERRAFLFENVASAAGRKYNMSVLSGACASSRAIYALGMGCREEEIFDRWINAQKNPCLRATRLSVGFVIAASRLPAERAFFLWRLRSEHRLRRRGAHRTNA
ncbi:MAG TPA: hypothetical protein VFS84_10865, partial [Candidatus Binatia bacterium]|nr:hypothetical protein [Candidatus Binatia bacterium]